MAASTLKHTPTNGKKMTELETSGVLPTPIAQEIWKKGIDQSVVQKVAGDIAMPITGASVAMRTGEINAGVVSEGELKPIGKTGVTIKTVKPIKVAAIAYVSKEAVQANKLAALDVITEDFASAIARAIDMAIIHGKDAKSGATIPGVEYLTQSTKNITLGTATKADGGLAGDFLKGYADLVEAGYAYEQIIADPVLRPKLMGAMDTQGRPIFQSALNFKDGMDTLFGVPVAYGKKVIRGLCGASTEDTKVRAIAGDFKDNLRLGFVEKISYSSTDQATLIDGDSLVPLWQSNMKAFLVEAQFGWVIRDKDAFVIHKDK